MARALYETDGDRARELAIAARIGEFLCRGYTKLPINSGADFLFSGPGKPDVAVEIKSRTTKSEKYPTYMVSRSKYDRLRGWSVLGCRAALFVHWTDCIGYVMIPAPSVLFAPGGRIDRGDALDTGTMAYIPVGSFKSIGPGVL